jgi:hypothetical protein
LRAPFTLVLLIAVPVVFVVSAASTLHDFADALGGSLASDAAVALSAGWAAAFLSGALGFFEAASSRGADRRLACRSSWSSSSSSMFSQDRVWERPLRRGRSAVKRRTSSSAPLYG